MACAESVLWKKSVVTLPPLPKLASKVPSLL
jgi:hypothetical protein